MKKDEFLKGMGLLSVAYQSFKEFQLDQLTLEVWYSFFEDIKSEVFVVAIKQHIKTMMYPPKISELRQRCETVNQVLRDETLKKMYELKYFHRETNQTIPLSDALALRNYEKAARWLSTQHVPNWFMQDMLAYEPLVLTTTWQHERLA